MSEPQDHRGVVPDPEREVEPEPVETTDEEEEVLAELDEDVPGVDDPEEIPEAEEEAALRLREQQP